MHRIRSLGGVALLALSLAFAVGLRVELDRVGGRRPLSGARPRRSPRTVDAANGSLTFDQAPTSGSCPCRRPRPRCCSRSAPATRLWRRTATRTTRPRRRRPNCRRMSRTWRRSPPTSPTSSCTPTIPATWRSSLNKLKIPASRSPAAATLDDVYAQMSMLGHDHRARRRRDLGERRVARPDRRPSSIRVGDAGKGKTYYYELDDTYLLGHVGHVHRRRARFARS